MDANKLKYWFIMKNESFNPISTKFNIKRFENFLFVLKMKVWDYLIPKRRKKSLNKSIIWLINPKSHKQSEHSVLECLSMFLSSSSHFSVNVFCSLNLPATKHQLKVLILILFWSTTSERIWSKISVWKFYLRNVHNLNFEHEQKHERSKGRNSKSIKLRLFFFFAAACPLTMNSHRSGKSLINIF